MNIKLALFFLTSLATLPFAYGQTTGLSKLEIPKTAPSGFESVITTKLNKPLQPGAAYEIGFWIFGRQLPDQSYSYPIAVFPSSKTIINDGASSIVESVQPSPKLEVNPPPSFATRGHFTFIVRPDQVYDHLTVALENEEGKPSPIDFKKDITVIGVFAKPLPSGPKTKTILVKKAGIKKTAIPAKIAERTLIDSKKSYTVSENKIQLGLYDHRRIDNDIVTIYLNGEIAVEHVQLKSKKQFFDLILEPGQNIITLHAENLGEVAPNTAAILIKTETEEFMAVLESDLGQSSYFKLLYEQ